MNKEEIEKRIDFCEKKARDYREIGKNFIANKYDDERYKWEKLLSDLDLLEKRKINELLEYKKGYYNQKEILNKINSAINGDIDGFSSINEKGSCNDILELLEIYKGILEGK